MRRFIDSSDFLSTVVEGVEEVEKVAINLTKGLDDDRLNWRPDPKNWSAAQCLDHLAVTTESFARYFKSALDQGRLRYPSATAPPFKPTWIGGWLIRQLLPESARRIPAPKIFRPSQQPRINGALDRFLVSQQALLEIVRDARGIDYNRVKLRSPVSPLIHYSLADSFVVNVVHAQRHLQQARRVLRART